MENAKLSGLSEKFQKIEEAAKSELSLSFLNINTVTICYNFLSFLVREEQCNNFIKQTEQKLIEKMESNKENKAQILNSLMDKLRKTDNKISQIKELTNQTTAMLEERIKNK